MWKKDAVMVWEWNWNRNWHVGLLYKIITVKANKFQADTWRLGFSHQMHRSVRPKHDGLASPVVTFVPDFTQSINLGLSSVLGGRSTQIFCIFKYQCNILPLKSDKLNILNYYEQSLFKVQIVNSKYCLMHILINGIISSVSKSWADFIFIESYYVKMNHVSYVV